MNVRSSLTRIPCTILLALSFLEYASAESTRAARLTLAQGTVTITQADASTVPGQTNFPLLTGVQVSTGADGRAEIEFEDGSVIRLAPNSALSLDTLAISSDGVFVTDLSLLHGLVYSELRATPQYSFLLNAGGDILSPLENTTVRISFDQPPAVFSVLEGTAEIDRQPQTSAGYQAQVHSGETFRSDPSDPDRYFLTQEIATDSWDQWNDSLDRQAATQATDTTSVRDTYAGADGYGWSDLDANGNWYNIPGDGPVWQPQDADNDPSFDPYANGAWVWYPSTGYIWASGYSWGWTPYRCGTWSYYNNFGWAWSPGAACGLRGWGFDSGGGPVNIGRSPRGYRPIQTPRPRSGIRPPILRITHPSYTLSPGNQRSAPGRHGPPTINGIAVSRIPPNHLGPIGVPGTSSSGPSRGWSLRRDFPIDPATHTPVLGRRDSGPLSDHTPPSARPEYPRSPSSPRSGSEQETAPTYPSRGQDRPSPTDNNQPHSWPSQPPVQSGTRIEPNQQSPTSPRQDRIPPPQHSNPDHPDTPQQPRPDQQSRPDRFGQRQEPYPERSAPRQDQHPEHPSQQPPSGPPQQPHSDRSGPPENQQNQRSEHSAPPQEHSAPPPRPASEPPRQESHPSSSSSPRQDSPQPSSQPQSHPSR